NQLNVASRSFEGAAAHVESFRWQLFADWYRYFQVPGADTTSTSTIFNHASNHLLSQWTAPNTGLQATYTQAQATLRTELQAVKTLLTGTALALKSGPGPRYWQPTDPAVLLAGPDLSFPLRYGGDTRFRADGLLFCRTTDELVSQVTA